MKIFAKEHRKNLRNAKLKNPVKYWLGKFRNKHPLWKNDDIGYRAIHYRILRYKGKPKKCIFCDLENSNKIKIHWANVDHKYKQKLTDWISLCARCHGVYDSLLRRNLI